MEVRQAIPLSTRGLFIIAQERERETLDELVNSTLLFCLVLAAPKKGWSSSAYHMKSDLDVIAYSPVYIDYEQKRSI
jgi:hypothetical protein